MEDEHMHDTMFSVFVDYDNLLPPQKKKGILDVVTRVLIQVPLRFATKRATCSVRIYGGWYEETEITRQAEDVSAEIQRDFPKVIRLPNKSSGCGYIQVWTNAELAVALIQEPNHHLFNTYRRKGRPRNVRIEDPMSIGCDDSSCTLPLMKKLLKKGKCPKASCRVENHNLVYRLEQKIIDTMLSCDLIFAACENKDEVILVSGDDDFIPPLRTIALRGATVVRFHPKPNKQRNSFSRGSVQLLEMDL